jgi:hypothetical protein
VDTLRVPSRSEQRSLRELMAAGLVGSSIEWYDFFVFATAAALVFPKVFFPKVFFPNASPLIALLLSFSTVWAGFVARPIGAFLAEPFTPEVRCSGASPAYQPASILVGGGTPFVMAAVLASTGTSASLSAYLVVMSLITLGAAYRSKDVGAA